MFINNAKLIGTILTLFFGLLFSGESVSGEYLGGVAANYIETVMFPILIKNEICKNLQDCKNKGHISYESDDSIYINVYDIDDRKVMGELIAAVWSSDLKIGSIEFRKKGSGGFFAEKPIVKLIDRSKGY